MPAVSLVLLAACWLPPVDAPIVDPFRPPACTWCPGNRGVEYATPPSTAVRAVAAGAVTYAGMVAGTSYVVIRHADGRRVTYGGLRDVSAAAGDVVAAGTTVGITAGALHLGLRGPPSDADPESAERYEDPAPWIGELVHRARLVPTDGSSPRRGPPPRLVCAASRA